MISFLTVWDNRFAVSVRGEVVVQLVPDLSFHEPDLQISSCSSQVTPSCKVRLSHVATRISQLIINNDNPSNLKGINFSEVGKLNWDVSNNNQRCGDKKWENKV